MHSTTRKLIVTIVTYTQELDNEIGKSISKKYNYLIYAQLTSSQRRRQCYRSVYN